MAGIPFVHHGQHPCTAPSVASKRSQSNPVVAQQPLMFVGAAPTDPSSLWLHYLGAVEMKVSDDQGATHEFPHAHDVYVHDFHTNSTQGLEDSYGVVSVQPFRLVARLASFAPPVTAHATTGDAPPTPGLGGSSGMVQRRLSSWFSRPMQRSMDSMLRRGSVERSVRSQEGTERRSISGPQRTQRVVAGGLPEDSVPEHDELEQGMSQHHEVELLSVAHGIDLSESQREQARRLAQLYEEHDNGLGQSMNR